VLAEGTYLAVLHPARTADGPPITVRVIEYTVHTSPADGGEGGDGGEKDSSEVFALVTDLLDAEVYPALEPACALWVPGTLSRHATCTYSCTRPPSRSRRRGRMIGPEGGGVRTMGGC
jgi:hypothetical protein